LERLCGWYPEPIIKKLDSEVKFQKLKLLLILQKLSNYFNYLTMECSKITVAARIPKIYPLEEILAIAPRFIPTFLSILRISTSDDNLGQIALSLDSYGKLSYPPLNTSLETLLVQTKATSVGSRYDLIYQLDNSTTSISFSDLPFEIQMDILERIPITNRAIARVSKGMKELADIALINNIRHNNLVDPTIGIPNRKDYFKVDTAGDGEYFSSEPGLWRIFEDIRLDNKLETRPDVDYILIYGTLKLSNALLNFKSMKPTSDVQYNLRVASVIRMIEKIIEETSDTTMKFVGIGTTTKYEIALSSKELDEPDGLEKDNEVSIHGITHSKSSFSGSSIITLGPFSKGESIEAILSFTENPGKVFNIVLTMLFILNTEGIPLLDIPIVEVNSGNMKVQVVSLSECDIENNVVILPSLQDDVYII